MSLSKLKLGNRKREHSIKPLIPKQQQKMKQLSQQIIESFGKNNRSSKPNFINLKSSQLNDDFINLNRYNISIAPQTERIRKIDTVEHLIHPISSKKQTKQTVDTLVTNNSQQNQNISASQLLDALNIEHHKKIERYQQKGRSTTFNQQSQVNKNMVVQQKKEILNGQVVQPSLQAKIYKIQNIQQKSSNGLRTVPYQTSKTILQQIQLSSSPQQVKLIQKQVKGIQKKVKGIQIQVKDIQQQVKGIQKQVKQQQLGITSTSQATQQTIQTSSPSKSAKLSYKGINQVQIVILQQNKSLTNQVQVLRKQRDNLLFSNKRLQVQLLQSNCKQYYQRQMIRLKNQVELLQAVNQELKHNSFVTLNRTKELQATDQLNKKQIKKIIKQLQQIKMDSAKQKFQLKQKTKALQDIVKQLQARNTQLSIKFQEFYNKAQQLQKIVKIKNDQQFKLRKYSQSLQSKILGNQRVFNQKKKHYQQQIQRYITQTSQLSNKQRNIRRQSQSQIQVLKQNIKQLNLKRQSQVLLIQSRTKFLEKHNNSIQTQLQVVRLEQNVKELKDQINKRSILIKDLNHKVDHMISMNDYQALRKDFQHLTHQNTHITKKYQTKIITLNQQIENLNIRFNEKQQLRQNDQNSNILSSSKGSSTSIQKQNFKQILKQQILQCDNLKQQIYRKTQQIFQGKQDHQDLLIKYNSLKNEFQILKKHHLTFQNNSKIKKQILEQQSINQIQSLRRKLEVLDKRFQSKIRENKEKETFITNFIVGKANHSDANYLIKELERVFLEKEKHALLQ